MLLSHAPTFGETKRALQNQKDALIYENDLVVSSPGAFYLVIDLPAQQIHLKADGNLLRVCSIQNMSVPEMSQTQTYRFVKRVDPFTVEPGNGNITQRNRLLPLDFYGRLTKGSRHHSRLYFTPDLILQSKGMPGSAIPHLILSEQDIKALGSALRLDHAAITIPQLPKAIP